VPPAGRNLETAQIAADEDNARRRGCWEDADANWDARVKPYTRGFDTPLDRRLKSQNCGSKLGISTY